MKINVPWWMWPWPQAKRAQAHIALNKALARELEEQARSLRSEQMRTAYLEGEMRQLSGSTGNGAPSSQTPDFVLVGIPRPGVGVRLWASRKLSGTRFDMTPIDDPPPRWKIAAIMDQALTIDRPDYTQAMAEMGRIWQNWDRAAREEKTYAGRPSLRPGIDRGQVALPPGAKERWKSNLPADPG